MTERKTLKEHIVLLANGQASAIVVEMKHSIEEIEESCQLFPSLEDTFSEPKQIAITKIESEIESIDELARPMERLEESIQNLQTIPGILKFRELERQLISNETRPSMLPSIRRDVQKLRSAYNKELKDVVNFSHEALAYRIKIVGCWSNVSEIEVEFLEELMYEASAKLMFEAETSGERDLLDALQSTIGQLQERRSAQSYANRFKISESVLRSNNLKVLKESLRSQLTEIVRMEMVLEQKYETLNHLADIEVKMKSKLPKGHIPGQSPGARTSESTSPRTSAIDRFSRMARKR